MKVYSFTNNKKTEVPLTAHIVYDVASGKIVHRHWTFADGNKVKKERLLGMVRTDLRTPNMDVLTVGGEAIHKEKKYHVDTEKHTLEEAQ